MSNYTKTTDFAAKDALLTGNPSKLVKGTEINVEFSNIQTAVNSKLDSSEVTAFAATLLDDVNAATARGTLGAAESGANADITSMTGLSNGGIPLVKVSGAAASGANTDITSMTGLSNGGIPLVKVSGAAASGANTDITSMTGLSNGGIPLVKVSGAAASGANADITSMTALSSINGGQLAGLRNRIINGGMQVAQRGGVAITNGVAKYGGCDRTIIYPGGFSTAAGTVQQAVVTQATSGLAQHLNVTTTGTGNIQAIQKIEAVNVKDLNSKTVTVSAILHQDTGAALNAIISLYKTGTVDNWATPVLISTSSATSIPSASATAISKQFTLGASDATNGLFVQIQFQGVGAVTSKNFYIWDFQLEIGSVSTTFEQRPYGMELALCQRYLPVVELTNTFFRYTGQCFNTADAHCYVPFPVQARVAPAGFTASSTVTFATAAGAATGTATMANPTTNGAMLNPTGASGLVPGNATGLLGGAASTKIFFDGCEL